MCSVQQAVSASLRLLFAVLVLEGYREILKCGHLRSCARIGGVSALLCVYIFLKDSV